MVFENGVKNIQAAAYNGARTVPSLCKEFIVMRHNIGHSSQGNGKTYTVIPHIVSALEYFPPLNSFRTFMYCDLWP
jgi:hypothetical protein